jgi:diguanylate cyclase (GGDEF)-like protein
MPKILIADDNEEMLETLVRIFSLYEFTVDTALNGIEAIEKAGTNNPDIILLDGMMPEMDGFEACRLLKKNEQTREIPVVFLTANFMELRDRIKGLELGADDYLLKPFNSKELVARIKSILKRTHLSKTLKEENQKLIQKNSLIEEEFKNLLEKHKINDKKQITDPVTGLYTFEFFKKQADNELNRSQRFNNDLSLIIIYFKNAKKMKEILGIQLFNYLIIKIANFILTNTRIIDLISFEEHRGFYMLLPQTDYDGAVQKVGKLIELLMNNSHIDDEILKTLEFSKKKLSDISKLIFESGVAVFDEKASHTNIDDLFIAAENTIK